MTLEERYEASSNGWGAWMEKYTKLCQECAISERNIILCVASFYITSFGAGCVYGGSSVNGTLAKNAFPFSFCCEHEQDRTENGENINFIRC